MILNAPPTWNADAAALLRQFLDSGAGQVCLAHLAAARPPLPSGNSDVNSAALMGAEAAGYERAINTLISLAEPPREAAPASDNYPSLDDDEAWAKKN